MMLRNRTVQQFLAIAILAVFVSLKRAIDTRYKNDKSLIVKVDYQNKRVIHSIKESEVFRLTAQNKY